MDSIDTQGLTTELRNENTSFALPRKIVVSSPKEDVSEVVLSSNFGAKYVDTRSNVFKI